jgi:hypothetical protein
MHAIDVALFGSSLLISFEFPVCIEQIETFPLTRQQAEFFAGGALAVRLGLMFQVEPLQLLNEGYFI